MTTIPLGVFGPQILLLGLIPLVVFILFALSMQKAMNTVSTPNRKMDGGLIWLTLIPILNIVWPFIFNNALRESYRKEFSQKGIPNTVNLSSGIIYPAGQMLLVLIALMQFGILTSSSTGYSQSDLDFYMMLNVISALLGLLSFILWIVFWVNVNTLREVLVNHNQSYAFSNSGQQPIYTQPTQHQNPPYSTPVQEHYPSQEATPPPPPQAPIPETVKPVSTVDKLKKYHDMLSEGLITQADFDRIKNELLNQK
jgi:hypothetical protein